MGDIPHSPTLLFFFFNDTATTEIYTLSLHDALPIYRQDHRQGRRDHPPHPGGDRCRSEEHTSELQSHSDLVCRLLLEKKKQRRERRKSRTTKKNPARRRRRTRRRTPARRASRKLTRRKRTTPRRFFFFNDTATTEIYTLSLHDALPISRPAGRRDCPRPDRCRGTPGSAGRDRKSTRLNSSHTVISYAVFCLKKKKP